MSLCFVLSAFLSLSGGSASRGCQGYLASVTGAGAWILPLLRGFSFTVIYLMEISSSVSLLHWVIAGNNIFLVTRANVTTYNRKGERSDKSLCVSEGWAFFQHQVVQPQVSATSNSDQHCLPQVRLECGNLEPSISCLEEGCHDMVTRQRRTSQVLTLPLTKHTCWCKAFWNLSLVLQKASLKGYFEGLRR